MSIRQIALIGLAGLMALGVFLSSCNMEDNTVTQTTEMTTFDVAEGGQITFGKLRIASSSFMGFIGAHACRLWLFHKDSPLEETSVEVKRGTVLQDGEYCVKVLDFFRGEGRQLFVKVGVAQHPCGERPLVTHDPHHRLVTDMARFSKGERIVATWYKEPKLDNVAIAVTLLSVGDPGEPVALGITWDIKGQVENSVVVSLPAGSEIQSEKGCFLLAQITESDEKGHPIGTFYWIPERCASPAIILP